MECRECGKRIAVTIDDDSGIKVKFSEKDTVGLNKKILNPNAVSYYCVYCMSELLECEVLDLYNKMQDFKESGCTLFS